MSGTIALRNTKMSAIIETVEGTPQAETAASAFITNEDGIEFNLGREMIANMGMTGSLTESAPAAGMYSEDLGLTTTINMRGTGTIAKPEWAVFMQSIMGSESANTDGVIDLASTTTNIIEKSGGGDIEIGQQVYFPTQVEISRVITSPAGSFTIWPPLTTTPSEDDTFIAGFNWLLTSDDYPSFTSYSYFDGLLRLVLAGCKTVNLECKFAVGQIATMAFTVKAITAPTHDHVAQAVTPIYDDTTKPLMCLGITSKTILSGVAQGTPTQIETVLTAPTYQVLIGDTITLDVGAGVYETVAITGVSGVEGANQTLDHDSVSVAASADDIVYITHDQCAYTAEELALTIEITDVAQKCMVSSSGFVGRAFTKRVVNISRSPFFTSWQEFLMRDGVIGSALWITLGDEDNNIVSFHIPNQVSVEVDLTTDELMSVDVTGQGVKDALLGDNHEISIAAF